MIERDLLLYHWEMKVLPWFDWKESRGTIAERKRRNPRICFEPDRNGMSNDRKKGPW